MLNLERKRTPPVKDKKVILKSATTVFTNYMKTRVVFLKLETNCSLSPKLKISKEGAYQLSGFGEKIYMIF